MIKQCYTLRKYIYPSKKLLIVIFRAYTSTFSLFKTDTVLDNLMEMYVKIFKKLHTQCHRHQDTLKKADNDFDLTLVPDRWVVRMRETLATLKPSFMKLKLGNEA